MQHYVAVGQCLWWSLYSKRGNRQCVLTIRDDTPQPPWESLFQVTREENSTIFKPQIQEEQCSLLSWLLDTGPSSPNHMWTTCVEIEEDSQLCQPLICRHCSKFLAQSGQEVKIHSSKNHAVSILLFCSFKLHPIYKDTQLRLLLTFHYRP